MFPDTDQLFFFLTATIILNLTPGSDVLYVASQSLNSFKHGIVATVGVGTGIAIYAIASALGLSSILMQSPLIFNFIKVIGAFYLFYLAWQAFFHSKNKQITPNKQDISVWKSYKNWVLTNILNPKVGIFLLTFLPQFIDIERGVVWLQLLTLGGCFVISGTLINFLYVFFIRIFKGPYFFQLKDSKISQQINRIYFLCIGVESS